MIQEQQSPMEVRSWAFILNKITVSAELPFELAPGCLLAKATPDQRTKIKAELSKLAAGIPYSVQSRYESDMVSERDPQGREIFVSKPLPESDWNYYVITTEDAGIANINLQFASNISDISLDFISLTFLESYGMNGKNWRLNSMLNHFMSELFDKPATNVTESNLNELKKTYRLCRDVVGGISGSAEFSEIQRALEMYDNLSLLPPNSEFHILGLFAIIEMLITHNPKLEDRGDSITHQMKSKIPLLSRRFEKPLDVNSFFCATAEERVWSALYKYRSSLAHGGLPDFQKGELKCLKDSEQAKAFLKVVVKSLIKHALHEPYLYRDLRNC